MEEFRIERLSNNNINDLQYLYKDAFGEERSLASIKQKFNTSEYGPQYIAYLAYDSDNKPAAFYSLFPIELSYKNKTYLAGQLGDLMTHSKHRRKGLFINLATKTHELAKKEGLKIVITVIYKGLGSFEGVINRLNFTHRDDFNEYNIKVKTLPILYFAERISFLKKTYNIYQFIILLFFKKYNYFNINNIENLDEGEIIKDEKFFRYKKYNKSYIISLKGIRVWFKIHNGSIFIGDIEKARNLNIKKLIKKLKFLSFILGIRNLQFELSPDSFLDNLLKKHYTHNNNYHFSYLMLEDNVPIEKIKFVFGDFDSF